MGMYNNVKYSAKCLNNDCDEIITNWQTKSSKQDLWLETVQPEDCDDFYADCYKCQTWNEYEVLPSNVRIVPRLKDSEYDDNPGVKDMKR